MKELGASIVPGITLGGEDRLPLVVADFDPRYLEGVDRFHANWHEWNPLKRCPVLKTERFIAIPQEIGWELNQLAGKRSKGLTEKEENRFKTLLQLISTITAEEVVTSYEVTTPKENIDLAEFVRSTGEVDSGAVNGFLTSPLVTTQRRARGQVPRDARQKHVLLGNGDLIEVGTGKVIMRGVTSIEPLINGYYKITEDDTSFGFKTHKHSLAKIENGTMEVLYTSLPAISSITISPDKKFAFVDRDGDFLDGAVYDLEKGKKLYVERDIKSALSDIGKRPSAIYFDASFSRDGKYLTYFEEQSGDTSGIRGVQFVTIDLRKRAIVQKPFLAESDAKYEYAHNPFADVAFIRHRNTGRMFLASLATGDLYGREKAIRYLRTDSSGTITSIIYVDDSMAIYHHPSGKLISRKDMLPGQEFISNTAVYYKEDGKKVATGHCGSGHNFMIDDQGDIIRNEEDMKQALSDMMAWEIVKASGEVSIIAGRNIVCDIRDMQKLDPLQRPDKPNVYMHPRFNLVIDATGPKNPIAIDPKTNKRFYFKGEITKFSSKENITWAEWCSAGKISMASPSLGEDLMIKGVEAEMISFNTASPYFTLSFFKPIGGMAGEYSLHRHSDDMIPDKLTISPSYSVVSFDGKYIIFTDPDTGDTAYLDPEDPQNPVFVSARRSPPLLNEKPADAPKRFVIIKNKDNTFSILDTVDGEKVVAGGFLYFDKLRQVGNNTFIYDKWGEGIIEIGENKDKIPTHSLSEGESIHDHANGLLIIKSKMGMSVFDVKHWNSFSGEGMGTDYSRTINLSSSGRFSVHELRDGILIYYDHSQHPGSGRILLATSGTFGSYKVLENCDAVIVEGIDGKYLLFNLERDSYAPFASADHIEIDSSGTFAVFKFGNVLKTFNIKTGEVSPDYNSVQIASDEDHVFVNTSQGTIPVETYRTYQRSDGKLTSDGGSFAKPRFWEKYDLEKKTVWDIKNNESVASDIIFAQQYSANPPTKPHKTFNLSGEKFTSYIDGRPYIVSYLTGPRMFRDLSGNEKGRFFSLQGGRVWYSLTDSGVIDRVIIMPPEGVNEVPRGYKTMGLGEIFVNQNRTFILVGKKLIGADGNETDMSKEFDEGFLEAIDVDGRYFVLSDFNNPSRLKYLDPAQAHIQGSVAEEDTRDAEILALWKEKVLTKRDEFISQARRAYQPFLEMVPEEFKGELEMEIMDGIADLYKEQEKEVAQKFASAVAGGEQDLGSKTLPFGIFSERMSHIMPELKKYLESRLPLLEQEPPGVQKRFLLSIFTKLFDLAKNADVSLELVDEEFLNVLGHQWDIDTQEQVGAVRAIGTFISQLETAAPSVSVAQTSKIVAFISQFAKKDPAKNVAIVCKQLAKILNAKAQTRDNYLKKLLEAFERVDPKALDSYLKDMQQLQNLGSAREFAIFLTNEIEQLKTRERFIPSGSDIQTMPKNGVKTSQIMQLERMRPKASEDDAVMSMDYLIDHLNDLPEPIEDAEVRILLDTMAQRESGAHTAETAQNSYDGTRGIKGELVVDFFLQKGAAGEEEYAEEATDNGTGALKEVALLIPKSTKAAGGQIDITGFFGTGKYTLFEGIDRLEIITKNRARAYMFSYAVDRDASGNPVSIRLVSIRKIDDSRVKQGVTIRRIKAVSNTIPELDQMLSQRAWKIFAGLAQDENFTIFFIDHEGNKRPLIVEKEVLTSVSFKAIKPGDREETDFGIMRIISTKEMPLQIMDKIGLRVCEIKDEYLALIPYSLRKYITELGITIQIPLPLIRGRSAFEHESHYLPIIQKHVAAEFYKAIAYKTLTQTSPQFVFEGFPHDWETNDHYWDSMDLHDIKIISLAQRINKGEYDKIAENELNSLVGEEGKLDNEKKFVKLLMLLEVSLDQAKPADRTGLLLRRLAIQRETSEMFAKDRAELAALLEQAGFSHGRIPSIEEIPNSTGKLLQARGIAKGHDEMRNPEKYIIDEKDYTPPERELVDFAGSFTKPFGIEQVVLVSREVSFAGAFKDYKGKHTIFINRVVADWLGQSAPGFIDYGTDTINHELAHLLEELMIGSIAKKSWGEGYVAHLSNFTHDAIGTFAEAMKYSAYVWLANNSTQQTPRARASASGGSAVRLLPFEHHILADSGLSENSREFYWALSHAPVLLQKLMTSNDLASCIDVLREITEKYDIQPIPGRPEALEGLKRKPSNMQGMVEGLTVGIDDRYSRNLLNSGLDLLYRESPELFNMIVYYLEGIKQVENKDIENVPSSKILCIGRTMYIVGPLKTGYVLSPGDAARVIAHETVHAILSQRLWIAMSGAVSEAMATKVDTEFRKYMVGETWRSLGISMEEVSLLPYALDDDALREEILQCATQFRDRIHSLSDDRGHWGPFHDDLLAMMISRSVPDINDPSRAVAIFGFQSEGTSDYLNNSRLVTILEFRASASGKTMVLTLEERTEVGSFISLIDKWHEAYRAQNQDYKVIAELTRQIEEKEKSWARREAGDNIKIMGTTFDFYTNHSIGINIDIPNKVGVVLFAFKSFEQGKDGRLFLKTIKSLSESLGQVKLILSAKTMTSKYAGSAFGDRLIVDVEKIFESSPPASRASASGEDFDARLKDLWNDRMQRGAFRYELTGHPRNSIGRFNVSVNPGRAQAEKANGKTRHDLASVYEDFGSTADFDAILKERPLQKLFDITLDGAQISVCINYAPVLPYHFLLVPSFSLEKPQFIDREALWQVFKVIDMSNDPNLRMGFNSRGARASINHLHFQGAYTENGLPIEQSGKKELLKIGSVTVSQTLDYPARAVVMEGDDAQALAKTSYDFIKTLQEDNVPHTLIFGKRSIYIIPRSREGATLSLGWSEMGGEFYVDNAEKLDGVNEGILSKELSASSLSEEPFSVLVGEWMLSLPELSPDNGQARGILKASPAFSLDFGNTDDGHEGCFFWARKELPRAKDEKFKLIVFDAHDDSDFDGGSLYEGNWVRAMGGELIAGIEDYYLVFPGWLKPSNKMIAAAVNTGTLNQLKETLVGLKGPIILSIDFDYFACVPFEHKPSLAELAGQVNELFSFILTSGLDIRGVYFSTSRGYVPAEYKELIKRLILKKSEGIGIYVPDTYRPEGSKYAIKGSAQPALSEALRASASGDNKDAGLNVEKNLFGDYAKTLIQSRMEDLRDSMKTPDGARGKVDVNNTEFMVDLYRKIEKGGIVSGLVGIIREVRYQNKNLKKEDRLLREAALKKDIKNYISNLIKELKFSDDKNEDYDIKYILSTFILFRTMVEGPEKGRSLSLNAIIRTEKTLERDKTIEEFDVAGQKIKIGIIHKPRNSIIYNGKHFKFGGDGFLARQIGDDILFVGILDVAGHGFISTLVKTAFISWLKDEMGDLKSIVGSKEFKDLDKEERKDKINSLLKEAIRGLDSKYVEAINAAEATNMLTTFEVKCLDYKNQNIHSLAAGSSSTAYGDEKGDIVHEPSSHVGVVLGLGFTPDDVYVTEFGSKRTFSFFTDYHEGVVARGINPTEEAHKAMTRSSDKSVAGILDAIYKSDLQYTDDVTAIAGELAGEPVERFLPMARGTNSGARASASGEGELRNNIMQIEEDLRKGNIEQIIKKFIENATESEIQEIARTYSDSVKAAPDNMKDLVSKSFALSLYIHFGHKRKDGVAYITHPASVIREILDNIQGNEKDISMDELGLSMCVGWLHDVVEDFKDGIWGRTAGAEKILLKWVEDTFGANIRSPVDLLTQKRDIKETKEEYYKRLLRAQSKVANIVKLADLRCNFRDSNKVPGEFPQDFADSHMPLAIEFLKQANVSARNKLGLIDYIEKQTAGIGITAEKREELANMRTAILANGEREGVGEEMQAGAYAAVSTSFSKFVQYMFSGHNTVSFADIGSGPRGEFGDNLTILLRLNSISVAVDSVSVDNSIITSPGKVKYADIKEKKDRQGVGLNNDTKDIVSINNIINPDLLDPAVKIVKPGGILLVTFALSDVQSDYLNIVKDAKARIHVLSETDATYEYRLLGTDGEIKIPEDYPQANKEYGSYENMLVVLKVKKASDGSDRASASGAAKDAVEIRQAVIVDAVNASEGKDNDVKVVMGVPIGMNGSIVQPTLSAINRGLADNGFGSRGDNKQVIKFEIDINDPLKTAQNQEKAVQRAGEGLLPGGRIVLFAPQMEVGPQLAQEAQKQYKSQGNIIVVPDSYSDSAPEKEIYPDIMVRVALGRSIAFYYTGKDPQNTLAAINDILAKVADGFVPIVAIDDLLNILKPLRIRPVDYTAITDWQRAQEAVATAL
ncbi:MAG: SpoIIE family protein phosphatase [Candidatus Omnitrophota bacterium]|nr:SpoIIE family protein phosphatase [Candidatus Omnitrophota bacterium]